MKKPTINLNLIYTDVDTLIKYKIEEFTNFKQFGNLLVENEKFNSLNEDEIQSVIKKFEPKIKRW